MSTYKALKFSELRVANVRRIPEFRNRMGGLAHKKPDGSDWSLGEWMCALTGEVGEAANIIKKIRRGDYSLFNIKPQLADEFADIVIYLDLLAFRCGINLGAAVINKFNRSSVKVCSRIRL